MPKTMREQLEESFKNDEEARGSEEDTEESLGDSEEEEEEETEGPPRENSDSDSDDGSDDGTEGDGDDDEPPSDDDDDGEDEDDSGEEGGEEKEDLRAPVSWKPATREHWGQLPKEVKAEVLRREKEISQGLQQASGYKKVASEYLNTVRPFETLIRAQNSTPAQAITNLMQTAARLTMGTPTQKAQVITEIIKNYAVDVEVLDSVLSDEDIPDSTESLLMQKIEEKLKPVNDIMSQLSSQKQTEESSIQQQVSAELEEFANNPKNEFYDDVREDMADLLELAARRGRTVTLENAYKIACQNDPEISKILEHRASSAANKRKSIADKRKAASSIPGSSPNNSNKPKASGDLRASLEQAFDEAAAD